MSVSQLQRTPKDYLNAFGQYQEPRILRFARAVRRRSRGDQDLALVRVVRRADDALLLHLLDEPRRAVVADAQLALDPRDRRVARRGDDVDRLVVHVVVGLAARAAGQAELALAVAVVLARPEDVEVLDRP